ncbi:hypothetical protein ARALYDRAFT_347200 [Arabidopsis lyrata subsp. lyrata]|uniref:Lactate/malate dehydrogenase N-terminal domain-containing protein n=1 Tax=Arabidopsis lyrata subsp. lyrata TaxID=81972 RepID=D7LPR9_ARALL|nr:hypothetical protein ARALYDRAFT_347200 [Arabidopsis lyrata subsp. lyrata]
MKISLGRSILASEGVSSSCWKVPCHVGIFPRLAKASPDSILIIVSNHVDVLTYVAWKLSGFPVNRILGSCTNLKSSRFRFLIADHLDVNALEVQRSFTETFISNTDGSLPYSFAGYLFFRAKKEDIDSVNKKTAAKYGSVAAPIIVEKTTSSTMVAEPSQCGQGM